MSISGRKKTHLKQNPPPQNDESIGIGVVFTPLSWAVWVIQKYNLFEEWMKGAVILDPTAGEGNFLEAFITVAIQKDISLSSLPLRRLYAIEKEKRWVDKFHHKIRNIYGITFPKENFVHSDIFFCNQNIEADYLVGNPPWLNYNDLPEDYKPLLRPIYTQYGLVSNAKDVLLGNSRIDIATLVVAKTLKENLKPGGKAFFYLPLSIFQNEGANNQFRKYQIQDVSFAVKEIYDFNREDIFGGVSTRFGMVYFERDTKPLFPIPYYLYAESNWVEHIARPVFGDDSPLTVIHIEEALIQLDLFQKISVPKTAQPRQGVNTCGANAVFIFESFKKISDTLAQVTAKYQDTVILPVKYLFPVVTKKNFSETTPKPHKWILLPYDTATAKPLSQEVLEAEPQLWEYLCKHEIHLKNRKGQMIQAQIQKGNWWTLLGIGQYSFGNHKVIWEAFGRKSFRPIILSGHWQGNQALHAFIPMDNYERAEETLRALLHPQIENYLIASRSEGTCNWAQPGRLKPLLLMKED